MNTNTVLRFLGWAAVTYMWLEANCIFVNAIADAINYHNEQLRQKAIDEAKEFLKQKDESESEDESDNESEVVVETTVTETVTETISNS